MVRFSSALFHCTIICSTISFCSRISQFFNSSLYSSLFRHILVRTADVLSCPNCSQLNSIRTLSFSQVSKSERSWQKRYDMSVIIETQGSWEKRKDQSHSGMFQGMFFFRNIVLPKVILTRASKTRQNQSLLSIREEGEKGFEKGLEKKREKEGEKERGKQNEIEKENEEEVEAEKFAVTCQWEVPGSWVGDPLSTPHTNTPDLYTLKNGENESGCGSDVQISRFTSNQSTSASDLGFTPYQWNVDSNGDISTVESMGTGSTNTWSGGHNGTNDVSAFQMPDDNWVPGNDDLTHSSDVHSSSQMVHSTTPGAAMRGDRRWNTITEHVQRVRTSTPTHPNTQRDEEHNDVRAIVDKLLSSDELVRMLAVRLGLPVPTVDPGSPPPGPRPSRGRKTAYTAVGDDENNTSECDSNKPHRDRNEYHDGAENTYGDHNENHDDDDDDDEDEDDFWSDGGFQDDGDGAAAIDEAEEYLNKEYNSRNDVLKKRTYNVPEKAGTLGRQSKVTPPQVTYLDIHSHPMRTVDQISNNSVIRLEGSAMGVGVGVGVSGTMGSAGNDTIDNLHGMGWRKLPRPEVSSSFYSKVTCVHLSD